MPADLTARNIRTIDQYLELVARAIFASGLSWSVVDRRWPELRRSFAGFSAAGVAALSDRDLVRLRAAPGVIGNPAKIEAVRRAARILIDRRTEFGSVGRWLVSMEEFRGRQQALRAVPFVGPFGAYYVLSVAGFDVPDYETWQEEYGRALRTG